MDGRKSTDKDYLRNREEPHLPYCLRGVIPQILIVLQRDDRRKFLQGIFGVVTKERRWLLLASRWGLHKALA